MTIFLLFSIVLFFGILLFYPFKLMIISGILYLCFVPISFAHYLKLDKQNINKNFEQDNHEDIL